MEQYNRVYRDPKSPLMPLTPLNTNTFDFKIRSANSPYTPKAAPFAGRVQWSKQRLAAQRPPTTHQQLPMPRRFSKDFLKIRDIFERKKSPGDLAPHNLKIPSCACSSKANNEAKSGNESNLKQQKYKKASPIAPRILSPRIHKLLHKIGLEHFSGLFRRQEIDTEVFCLMTIEDMESLGITNPYELHQLLGAVQFAKEMKMY